MASTAPVDVSGVVQSVHQVRACRTCAISKAKCVWLSESGIGKCQRCERLSKECIPGHPAPKRLRRRRINRTAQLEQKLDGLVSFLTAQKPVPNSEPDAYGKPTRRVDSINDPLIPPPNGASARHWADPGDPDVDQVVRILTGPLQSSVMTSTPESHLQEFRNGMSNQFPFVPIPTEVSAEVLHTIKPFLYETVMMATSYRKVSRQLQLRSEVMTSLTKQIFVQGAKSLDLLQGLLVLAAWYHHHLWASPQLTTFVQLATALVFDLGLHRTRSAIDGNGIYVEATKAFQGRQLKPPRTLEERRAFLGLYCLSRALASNIGKIEPLHNTPYVEECCIEIEKQQEYRTDKYLVFQVRLQNVGDAAACSFPFRSVDYWSTLGAEPICMLVKSFERDLERFRDTLKPELVQDTLFQIHYNSISMHNTEIALRRKSYPLADGQQATYNPVRLSLLMTCLKSTKVFLTAWLSIPPNLYHHLPINIFSLLAHATIILGMLNTFRHEGWDLDYVREIAPFTPTMDSLARQYEAASRETDDGGTNGCSAFWRDGMKMRRLVEWYNTRANSRPVRKYEQDEGVQELPSGEATDNAGSGFETNILDDEFWNQAMTWMSFDDVG